MSIFFDVIETVRCGNIELAVGKLQQLTGYDRCDAMSDILKVRDMLRGPEFIIRRNAESDTIVRHVPCPYCHGSGDVKGTLCRQCKGMRILEVEASEEDVKHYLDAHRWRVNSLDDVENSIKGKQDE